jgi:hypothetical protein
MNKKTLLKIRVFLSSFALRENTLKTALSNIFKII